jgi:hypothetical protein
MKFKLIKERELDQKILTWLRDNDKFSKDETLRKLNVRMGELWASKKEGTRETMAFCDPCIVFPISDGVSKVYCYQRPDKAERWFVVPSKKKAQLFKTPGFDKAKSVLFVEGEWDLLKAYDSGFEAATGTAGAGTWKKEWDGAFSGKSVTICFDKDEPGREGARKVANKLIDGADALEVKILDLPFPEGSGNDLSDYLNFHSVEEFKTLLATAVPVVEKISKQRTKEVEVSFVELIDGTLLEQFYNPQGQPRHGFIHYNPEDETWKVIEDVTIGDKKYIPARPDIVEAPKGERLIYLPSHPEEYGNLKELIGEIKAFLKRYLYEEEIYLTIYGHYILFTWIFDAFPMTPYLRFIADPGFGKTRSIKILGFIGYKGLFSTGINSEAGLFRLISTFPGVLLHDEADMRRSTADIGLTKLLNQGNDECWPVVRCEGDGYKPKPFRAFSPKIIGTRFRFNDKALESRCFSRRMVNRSRMDLKARGIPLVLDLPIVLSEAQAIRNKLLMFRLRHLKKARIRPDAEVDGIDNRLNQIMSPLLSIIDDPEVKEEMVRNILGYQKSLDEEKTTSIEAAMVSAMAALAKETDSSGDQKYIDAEKNISIFVHVLCDEVNEQLKLKNTKKEWKW